MVPKLQVIYTKHKYLVVPNSQVSYVPKVRFQVYDLVFGRHTLSQISSLYRIAFKTSLRYPISMNHHLMVLQNPTRHLTSLLWKMSSKFYFEKPGTRLLQAQVSTGRGHSIISLESFFGGWGRGGRWGKSKWEGCPGGRHYIDFTDFTYQ